MKHKVIIAAVLAVCLMLAGIAVNALQPSAVYAATDGSAARDTISVTGTGIIESKPDQAVVIIGAASEHKDAKTASDDNKKTMNAIIEALKKQGIKDAEIRTYQYSIDPVYNYNASTPTVSAYRVTNLLSVVVSNTDKTGDVIDAATGAGANQTNSITFQMKDNSAMYQQALTKAMESAKTSATTLAKAAGRQIDVVVTVEESVNSYLPYERSYAMNSMVAADASTPISSGTASVTATVNVTYSLK